MDKYLIRIVEAAIPLTKDMSITCLRSGETAKLTLSAVIPKTYNIVGGRIIFVDYRCNAFAIPQIPGIKAILVSNDYRKDPSLEVPFISEYPTNYKDKWESLLAEMRAAV